MEAMKTIKLVVAVLVLGALGSCTKFLDLHPIADNERENFFQNRQQVLSALAGVYDILGKTETYGNFMLGRMGLDADQAYYRSATVEGVENNRTRPGDATIITNWRAWYDGINRANILLENIDRAVMDSTEREVIRGEALFLRAYYHFFLVTNWGDIPMMTESIGHPSEVTKPRTPSLQVYEQIETDMKAAEERVMTIAQVGHGGRVNRSAVRGILARVYLHWAGYPVRDESKYEDARHYALKVMQPAPEDGFQHDLIPDFEQVFINYCTDQYDIRESIWEVEFQGNGLDGGYSETGRVGSNNGIRYTGDDDGRHVYSYGYYNLPARTWYMYPDPDSYVSSDERRNWTISTFTINGTPAYETRVAITTKQGSSRNSAKWRRELELQFPKPKNAGPINFPLLRFSDVLLMFAEAENFLENGPSQEAKDAVNRVRRRAYGKDLGTGEVVKFINWTQHGSGAYRNSPPPTVTIEGGGGEGATAEAFVHPTSGNITHIKVTNQGSGYGFPPTITLSGPGAAEAILSRRGTSEHEFDDEKYGTQEGFQELIEEERTRELAFELLRKGDLVRWGKYEQYMHRVRDDYIFGDATLGINAAALTDLGRLYFQSAGRKDLLWPLPSNEMAWNRALRPQNYGY